MLHTQVKKVLGLVPVLGNSFHVLLSPSRLLQLQTLVNCPSPECVSDWCVTGDRFKVSSCLLYRDLRSGLQHVMVLLITDTSTEIHRIRYTSGSFVPRIQQSLQKSTRQRSLLSRIFHVSGPYGGVGARMSCCDLLNLSETRWLDSHLDPGGKRKNLTMIGWHRGYICVTHDLPSV